MHSCWVVTVELVVEFNVLLQLDAAVTPKEVDDVIDDPRFLGILNSSGWPPTKCITLREAFPYFS